MGKFRLWLELLFYRFMVSNEELSMSRSDRKLMNTIRHNFNDVECRMLAHERKGGSCSEIGGSGVSLMLMGFKVYVFRPVNEKRGKAETDNSGESAVIQFDKYRTKK